MFENPLRLEAGSHYWIVGPGTLDASISGAPGAVVHIGENAVGMLLGQSLFPRWRFVSLEGIFVCLIGFAIIFYGLWIWIQSALSYFWEFERNWKLGLIIVLSGQVYNLVMGILAAIMAKGKRERASFALEILRERCRAICGVQS